MTRERGVLTRHVFEMKDKYHFSVGDVLGGKKNILGTKYFFPVEQH
jgi:hypothetical protein